MDRQVELRLVSITNSQAQTPAFAMLLQEVDGERKLPIIIGAVEAQSINYKLNDITSARPLTHDIISGILKVFDIELMEVLIYKAIDGIFYSYLFLKQEERIVRMDSRTSDAIAVALRARAPIFIYESVLEKECIPPDDTLEKIDNKTGKESMNQKDIQTLHKELKRAVKEENYELASILRDEIARRQQ